METLFWSLTQNTPQLNTEIQWGDTVMHTFYLFITAYSLSIYS